LGNQQTTTQREDVDFQADASAGIPNATMNGMSNAIHNQAERLSSLNRIMMQTAKNALKPASHNEMDSIEARINTN
jgi:hypothetical protein